MMSLYRGVDVSLMEMNKVQMVIFCSDESLQQRGYEGREATSKQMLAYCAEIFKHPKAIGQEEEIC